jgi:hypothetical protein
LEVTARTADTTRGNFHNFMTLRNRTILFLTGLAAATAIACLGYWAAALLLWVVFDSCLAPRSAKCFANNLGTLNSALILQEALSVLFSERPELSFFATSYTDKNGVMAMYNQEVLVRTKTVLSAGAFGAGAVNVTDTDVPVTLNNWRQVYFAFTPQQYGATSRDLVQEAAEPAADAIAEDIIDTVAGLMTVGNYTDPAQKTVAAAGWDYTHLVQVRKALALRGVPKSGRFYLADSDVYASLLTDPMIVAFFNNPQNKAAIERGELPEVAGLMLGEYPNLDTAAGGYLKGFAGGKGAIVCASRAPADPADSAPGTYFPGNYGYITEPKSQFSVRVTEWIDPVTMNLNCRADYLFGYAVGQMEEGQLITTQ